MKTLEPTSDPDTWLNNTTNAEEALAQLLRDRVANYTASTLPIREVEEQVHSWGQDYSSGFQVALGDGSRLLVRVTILRPDTIL